MRALFRAREIFFILNAACALVLTPSATALTHAFIWKSDSGMTDLGSLSEGEDSVALGINDREQVVGFSSVNGISHGFLWTEATGMVDIGLFEGNLTAAIAINSRGVIAGDSFDGVGTSSFLRKANGTFVPLPQTSAYNVVVEAINDANKVAGLRYRSVNEAFTWDPKHGVIPLGFLPGGDTSEARDINNLDHITGWAGFPGGAVHVFLWTRSGGMTDLGTPEGTLRAYAEGINDQDEIVGEADLGTFQKIFYWSSSTGYRTLQTLGTPQGSALDLNNVGQITGSCPVPNTAFLHAVLWQDSLSPPQDLGTLPGGTNAIAYSINNLGQVVGQSDLIP